MRKFNIGYFRANFQSFMFAQRRKIENSEDNKRQIKCFEDSYPPLKRYRDF